MAHKRYVACMLTHRLGETIGVDGEYVGVLEVYRSRAVTEQEQEEVQRLGVVDEVAV